MKCMSVPANLTFEQWFALVERQCRQIGIPASLEVGIPVGGKDWWRSCYDDKLSVNEAVSIYTDIAEVEGE